MKKLLAICLFLFLLIGCSRATPDSTESAPIAPPSESENTAVPPTDAPEAETDTDAPEGNTAVSTITNMPEGWTQIKPGGDARCAHNTEFSFWVKPGNINKLLVYFQGGGGCWSGDTCQLGSNFYDASVGTNDAPNRRGGILDFNNPQNPFADYHAVYVPSCTGDIYLGDNIQEYETSEGETIEIYHHGFVNVRSVLDWTFANVMDPESIFVTGCSAGSIGSIRATPHLIHNYPNAEVTQLGDSLGFLFDQPTNADLIYGSHHTLPDWIPAFAEFDPTAFTMADFYNAVADYYPEYRFSQYNTERDSVQVRYHTAGGESVDTFAPALANAISAIHAESPNFRSYMADGTVHCIMPGGGFYSREVDGVLFRDWVADLAVGSDVENVQCEECLVDFDRATSEESEPEASADDAEQAPAWELVSMMPTPRSENRGVVINGRFYIPGGWGGESVFEAYDPAADSWETLADLPEGRHHFMTTTFDNKLYLFGGSPPNAYRPTDTAWMYDPDTDEWAEIASLPTPRLAGATVSTEDAIYIVGGASGGNPTPTYRYDPAADAWTELAALNQVSEHVAAVALDGKIYLFGGWERPGLEFARMEIYDIAADSWTDGGPMQFERGGLAAAVLDGQIYVVGGELLSSGQTVRHVERYDPATGDWTEAPLLPSSIHGFPLLSHDDALWIIGGSTLAGGESNPGRVLRFAPNG